MKQTKLPVSAEATPAALGQHYDLRFTKAVERVTARIRQRLKRTVSDEDWARAAPLIVHINRLKPERNALVLAHYYQSPLVYHGVADMTDDTLQLALAATTAKQPLVVQCGTRAMAETTRLLSPKKTVLLPDGDNGDAVMAPITPEDVMSLRGLYPGVPVIAHITATTAVKAAADICFTTSNAAEVINALPDEQVIVVPDQYLVRNLAKRTSKKLIAWGSTSKVHRAFTAASIAELRTAQPDVKIVAALECAPDVVGAADFAGALEAMVTYVRSSKPARVALLTDAAVIDNLAAELPEIDFVRLGAGPEGPPRISLESILWTLHARSGEVTVPQMHEGAARASLQRMLDISKTRA